MLTALTAIWLVTLECPHSATYMGASDHQDVAMAYAGSVFDNLTPAQRAHCEVNVQEKGK